MYLRGRRGLGWRAHLPRPLRVVVDPAADVLHEYEFLAEPGKAPRWLERNRLVFVFQRLLAAAACSCFGPVLFATELAMLVVSPARRAKLGGWWLARGGIRGWLVRPPPRDPAACRPRPGIAEARRAYLTRPSTRA